ncbi:hypothetical protein H8784_13325 [Parabacteroides acidifaciens]|uniref:Uncharacterized protein n=1 Tax=Parabacteroides acidifaciens TaxID=2290935 RepID=A0A3D8HDH8_9BACT|nr:hypothetical protein [Parabacteroides acidifaciens]MBC8602693.1 hypothetical protein [Parabacteroides acidifaciens]RDU48587.1 hypothetical protein DWU89_13685 [Parabacteroides acidifaciens]
MKRLVWILLITWATLPLWAQSEYISNSRYIEADRIENLSGNSGLLLLSKHNDLIISITNSAKKVSIYPKGERPDGYYEYCVIIDAEDTRTPKVEVSRRGSVYKTELTQTVKPDFLIAYRIEEVQKPIRMDDQTTSSDVHLNAEEAKIEFTTTIKNLKVECSPKLEAKVSTHISRSDPNISITTVVIPVSVLQKAQKMIESTHKKHDELDNKPEHSEEEWERLDSLQNEVDKAKAFFEELVYVTIYAESTNQLAIDIRDMGPRSKKCYAVLPLIIEKNVFVTECSMFMSEGGKLFGMRKYKDARIAYENALKSKDVVVNMRPNIQESITQCDTCILYESLAAMAIKKISEMKKNGTATQDEVAKYASAAIEFMQVLNTYNPDEFYITRIKNMKNMLTDMPLKIKFAIVEWKTLHEGSYIPNVEVWGYYGTPYVSSNTFSSDKKFKKILSKEGFNYKQIGVSNKQGIVEIELDRTNLPEGILFRPDSESNIKIAYMSIADLLRQAHGTYMEKQFRLRMYTK